MDGTTMTEPDTRTPADMSGSVRVPARAGEPVSVCEVAQVPAVDPAVSGELAADEIERTADPTLCPPTACDASHRSDASVRTPMLTEPATTPLDDDPRSEPADAPLPPRRRRRYPKKHPLAGTIPFSEALVCWTPLSEAATHRSTAGQVAVMRFPDRTGRSDAYACFGGAPDITDAHFSTSKAIAAAMRLFVTIVLRDGIRARTVHAAMIGISEFCLGLHPDVPGSHRLSGRPQKSNAAKRDW